MVALSAPSPPAEEVYEPKGGSRAMFASKAPRILLDGPAGTGKSRGLLEYAYAVMGKYPGLRVLACRKTRASMTDTILPTWETKVLGPLHPLVIGGASRETRREYKLANGSVMVIGGLDKPEKTFSAEYDLVLVFEAIECTDNDIELLLRSLRNGRRVINGTPVHQLIMDTNPGPEGHWLNHRDGWLTRILSRHEDNPYLWDADKGEWTKAGAEYIANLDSLTGHRKDRLRHGRWVAAEGVVYPEFDAAVHLIDAMPPGWKAWPKRRVIDFGFNDPFVCQWWAGMDDEWYMYREIYMSGRTVKEHADQINELSTGEDYEKTLADHDREDRQTLHDAGIMTIPAKKEIEAGIDAVKARLRKGTNGRARLYYLRSARVEMDRVLAATKRPTSTIEEYDCYVYKSHKDGAAKDVPVDRFNHGMDCTRYLCADLGESDEPFAWAIDPASPIERDELWRSI